MISESVIIFVVIMAPPGKKILQHRSHYSIIKKKNFVIINDLFQFTTVIKVFFSETFSIRYAK